MKDRLVICSLIVLVIFIAFFIMAKILKPAEVLKVEQKFKEADIQFDANLGQKVAWIKQKLDHFNSTDNRVWKQRVLVDIDIEKMTPTTPIFLNVPSLKSC